MVSYIILNENEKMRKEISLEIKRFLFSKSDCYKILEFDSLNKKELDDIKQFDGSKVFIMSIDNNTNLDIAKSIRKDGDYISPIIMFTKNNEVKMVDSFNNVLFLNLFKVDDRFGEFLKEGLSESYKIVTRHSVYTFSIFDEIYRIPYNDIYFIIKNLNDDSVTIYTKDDSYINYVTIKKLEETIGKDSRFFKTHRSCIINLYNVASYDRKNNIIVFNNGMTLDLISKNNRSLLAERLKNFSNVV